MRRIRWVPMSISGDYWIGYITQFQRAYLRKTTTGRFELRMTGRKRSYYGSSMRESAVNAYAWVNDLMPSRVN